MTITQVQFLKLRDIGMVKFLNRIYRIIFCLTMEIQRLRCFRVVKRTVSRLGKIAGHLLLSILLENDLIIVLRLGFHAYFRR